MNRLDDDKERTLTAKKTMPVSANEAHDHAEKMPFYFSKWALRHCRDFDSEFYGYLIRSKFGAVIVATHGPYMKPNFSDSVLQHFYVSKYRFGLDLSSKYSVEKATEEQLLKYCPVSISAEDLTQSSKEQRLIRSLARLYLRAFKGFKLPWKEGLIDLDLFNKPM